MRVLITAGGVYGPLDDNKLVGNRIRGIWAIQFARYLVGRGHDVTLLIPDTMPKSYVTLYGGEGFTVLEHHGFQDYRRACLQAAPTHDAMVMAAAVVNWIPAQPFKGKMPTKGYNVGDVIQIPFILAPRVIEEVKDRNPMLTLIGCKMLIGSEEHDLIDAAYGVLLKSRCNAVVANDMMKGLKRKILVNKDRSVQEFDNDFDGFYAALLNLIEDEYYHTEYRGRVGPVPGLLGVEDLFDQIVNEHRNRFTPVEDGRVFGSLALTVSDQGWLVSPREKGEAFMSEDASLVTHVDEDTLTVTVPEDWPKVSLNAPLLIRYIQSFGLTGAVHFHEQIPGLPTLPYAQPGTVRDSHRRFTDEHRQGFNIEGHGCVLPVNS